MIEKMKSKIGQAGLVVSLMAVAMSAHALPAEVTSAFTQISTDYADLSELAWPVAVAVTGGFVLLKLFKKFANKAT